MAARVSARPSLRHGADDLAGRRVVDVDAPRDRRVDPRAIDVARLTEERGSVNETAAVISRA